MTFNIIRLDPVISEKSLEQKEQSRYTFRVDLGAGKKQIARAVEDVFKVKVRKVNTFRRQAEVKRTKERRKQLGESLKRAVVFLESGKIDIFEKI